jgi:uncharacterized membrane protein YqaE (UPF0057 family)
MTSFVPRMLVAGPGMDCILNAILFIAGVIPGHIHGFYIIYTYFHRKRKVKKGRYPGGKKAGIFSEQVWNGGASNGKVAELLVAQRRREAEEEEVRMMKRGSRRSSGLARMVSGRDASFGAKRGASVRRSDAVMYDVQERRPVQRGLV